MGDNVDSEGNLIYLILNDIKVGIVNYFWNVLVCNFFF